MDLPNKEFVCKGDGKKKSIDGGDKVIELDVWAENEEGKKTTPGSAVVVFP
jgi:hypothetical protein